MKKIFFAFTFLLMIPKLNAAWMDQFYLGIASFTQTNEGPRVIPNTFPGTVFSKVVVATTSTAGTLKIYDSSGVASNQIANIALGTEISATYDIRLSSGLTYTTTSNSNGITIIYLITRP